MISKPTQNKLLEKILSSQEFANSRNYQAYLTYLVNSTDQGNCPKEITIAIEVFGKDSDFNPAEDTLVRSHTYTLRKKLESYYFHEGKDDNYQLVIPKGHYEVKFVPASENLTVPKIFSKKLIKHYPWLIVFILLLFLIYIWNQKNILQTQLYSHKLDITDPIWKEYLQSEFPIMLTTGNHFFFDSYIDKFKKEVTIRDVTINSVEELENLQLQFPNSIIKPSMEPYFPYHSIWSLPPILSILSSSNRTIILRKSADISPQILDEYNFIYAGSIKTLYILRHTLSKSHFDFEISPHKILYTHPDSSTSQVFQTNLHSTGPNEDLVLALKLPGPAENTIFIIASYHSLGAPEIANYLTSKNKKLKLEELFKEKYGRVPSFFEVLFRVVGIDKTAYNTEILIFNEIVID